MSKNFLNKQIILFVSAFNANAHAAYCIINVTRFRKINPNVTCHRNHSSNVYSQNNH